MIKNLTIALFFQVAVSRKEGLCTCPSRQQQELCAVAAFTQWCIQEVGTLLLTVEEVPEGFGLAKVKPQHRNIAEGKARQQAKTEVKAFQPSVLVAWRLQFGKQHSFLGTTSPKVHCGKNVPRTSQCPAQIPKYGQGINFERDSHWLDAPHWDSEKEWDSTKTR